MNSLTSRPIGPSMVDDSGLLEISLRFSSPQNVPVGPFRVPMCVLYDLLGLAGSIVVLRGHLGSSLKLRRLWCRPNLNFA